MPGGSTLHCGVGRGFYRMVLCLSWTMLSRGLSIRLSHAGIMWKWQNMSLNFFHHLLAVPFKFFHTKRYGNILTGTNAGGMKKITIFDQCLALSLK